MAIVSTSILTIFKWKPAIIETEAPKYVNLAAKPIFKLIIDIFKIKNKREKKSILIFLYFF